MDPCVVEVLRVGYWIPLLSLPPLSEEPIPFSTYSPSSIKGKTLEEAIFSRIESGAVKLAPLPSPGFYSRVFFCVEDLRIMETCHRPLRSEPFHPQDSIQNGEFKQFFFRYVRGIG